MVSRKQSRSLLPTEEQGSIPCENIYSHPIEVTKGKLGRKE
jgi:hypothetical protein